MKLGDLIIDGSVKWKICRIDNAKSADKAINSDNASIAQWLNTHSIDANADLNNIINTQGAYVCGANADVLTLKNKPNGLTQAFVLINLGSVPNLMIQMLYTYSNGELYIRGNNRYENTDHWRNWFKLSGSELK